MGRRRELGSLAERAARSRGTQATPGPPQVRHCWVTSADGRVPGLLLEWEQRVPGWHGRVVHPVRDSDGWIVVEEWLPAGLLEPMADHVG